MKEFSFELVLKLRLFKVTFGMDFGISKVPLNLPAASSKLDSLPTEGK